LLLHAALNGLAKDSEHTASVRKLRGLEQQSTSVAVPPSEDATQPVQNVAPLFLTEEFNLVLTQADLTVVRLGA